MSHDFISIGNEDAFVDKEGEWVEMLDAHYINTVEKTSSGVQQEIYVFDASNTQ